MDEHTRWEVHGDLDQPSSWGRWSEGGGARGTRDDTERVRAQTCNLAPCRLPIPRRPRPSRVCVDNATPGMLTVRGDQGLPLVTW